MSTQSIPLAEFQHRFDDTEPADVTWGQVRAWRRAAKNLAVELDVPPPGISVAEAVDVAKDTARSLSQLEGSVRRFLDGKASVAELAAALKASEATE